MSKAQLALPNNPIGGIGDYLKFTPGTSAMEQSQWMNSPGLMNYLQSNNLMGFTAPQPATTFSTTADEPQTLASFQGSGAGYQRGMGRAQGVGGPAITREQEAIQAFVYGNPTLRPPVQTMRNGTVVYRTDRNPQGNVGTLMARLYPNDPRYSPNAGTLARLQNRTLRAMGAGPRPMMELQANDPGRAFERVSGLLQQYGPQDATRQAGLQQQFRDNYRWLYPQGA